MEVKRKSHMIARRTVIILVITAFLLGLLVESIIFWFMIRNDFDHIRWTVQHPKEVQWTIDRFNLFQKASSMLFFEETNGTGVTIVKPTITQ